MAQDAPITPDNFEDLFEQAREAYRAKDYEAAFQQFLPLAQAGYAKAQDYIGYLYRRGEGVEQDFSRAFLWLSRAANQGVSSSKADLGVMYDNGESVPADYRRSHSLYLEAANEGDAFAMAKAGEDYLGGWGTYKDALLALEWYTKARDAGRKSASEKIAEIEAMIFEPKVEIPEGMSVEQFIEDLKQRVIGGDPDACFTWALCARDGIGREKQAQFFLEDLVTAIRVKSSAAIDMAKKVGSGAFERFAEAFYSAKMYQKAWLFADLSSALGNPAGYFTKGIIRMVGNDCEVDEAAAAEYLRKAAEKDEPRACYYYGEIHRTGRGVEKDSAKRMHWLCRSAELGFEKAAKEVMEAVEEGGYSLQPDQMGVYETAARAGNDQARYELAVLYQHNLDEEYRDLCKAVLWFERGIAAGDKDAAELLDEIYASEEWDGRDSLALPALYGKAAEDGHAFAALRLANAYLDGTGVEQDKAKAAQFFVKAGNAGSGEGFYRAYCLYRDGDGVRKDPSWAMSLLKKGTDLKFAEAQYELGCAYRDGVGVAQDILKAIDCFFYAQQQGHVDAIGASAYQIEAYHDPDVAREQAEMAAQMGSRAAKLLIAQKILVGSSYDADPQEARKRFEELAAEGGELACYANLFLGVIYLKGIGVESDLAKSLELLVLSADQGCYAAAEILDGLREEEDELHEKLVQEAWQRYEEDNDAKRLSEARAAAKQSVIPNIMGGWSRRASSLAKEHPDHANYELLLGKLIEIGENRFDAAERRNLLFQYAEAQVMARKSRHGGYGNPSANLAEIMVYLRSHGLDD